MSNRSFSTLAFATAVATLTPAALPAATTLEGAPSVKVGYGDLDLDTVDGAAQLKARIARAAKQVCGTADYRDLRALADMRTCRLAAVAGADATMRMAANGVLRAPDQVAQNSDESRTVRRGF